MATYRQEMPPKGGYKMIDFAKKPPKKGIPGKYVLLGVLGWHLLGIKIMKWHRHRYTTIPKIENRDADFAVEPLLQAERNRLYLLQMIENRREEAEIMKDEPGWINGTYYGSPVIHNTELWLDGDQHEYYAHATPKAKTRFNWERQYH